MYEHPVRLTNEEGLERSRLTVFFRLLLALPHIVWFGFWSVGVLVIAIVSWFITVFRGRTALFCHNFITAYLRYSAHLGSYLSLTAHPWPDFVGRPGSYPVDVHLPQEPQVQNRWKTAFRLILAIPALLVDGALAGAVCAGASHSGCVRLSTASLPWWLRLLTLPRLRCRRRLSLDS